MFKWVNRLLILLCYFPYIYFLIYYSYVARAIIKLGRVPTPENPDPKALGFTTHRELIYRSADIVVVALGLFILLFLIMSYLKKITVRKIHLNIAYLLYDLSVNLSQPI